VSGKTGPCKKPGPNETVETLPGACDSRLSTAETADAAGPGNRGFLLFKIAGEGRGRLEGVRLAGLRSGRRRPARSASLNTGPFWAIRRRGSASGQCGSPRVRRAV
jgi:hypothetical protein